MIEKGGDAVLSAVHAGPNILDSDFIDEHSDVIASLVWKKTGGKLIISHTGRNPLIGINLNRKIPSMKKALKYYNAVLNKNKKRREEFEDRYAFAARNFIDFWKRRVIYNKFWREHDKDIILFVHTSANKKETYPGVVDITIFENFFQQKLSSNEVTEIINELNKEYNAFFKRRKDELIKVSCTKEKANPRITYEHRFTGSKSYGPRRMIFDKEKKIIVMFEIMKTLALNYPERVSDIIIEFYELTKKLKREQEFMNVEEG